MESIWGPTADFHVYIKPIDRGGKRETSLINGPPPPETLESEMIPEKPVEGASSLGC